MPQERRQQLISRVAGAAAHQALYRIDRDRRYRATRPEREERIYRCPRCPDQVLAPTVYRRELGQSLKLLGCHACLFLVRKEDIDRHHETEIS